MKNIFCFLSMLSVMIIFSGCIFTPRNQSNSTYYDLAVPNPVNSSGYIRIAALHNDTPSQSRMLYRLRGNRIVQDSLNSWAQVPERILQRYLEYAFPLNGDILPQDIITLRCKLNSFEFDIARSEAVLSIKYIMILNNKRQYSHVTIREKFSSRKPEDLAAAMDRAAGKMAVEIGKTAEKFYKNSK